MSTKSLQETYAPDSICFGCGPANSKGLQIKSFAKDGEVTAEWTPQSHHEAFPGMLNGGIIGSLLDCHSNWTAAWALFKNGLKGEDGKPPCTVTAEYKVKLRRPTPSDQKLVLTAQVVELQEDRAWVEAKITSDTEVCATCKGLFVAVKPGHPAYHRW